MANPTKRKFTLLMRPNAGPSQKYQHSRQLLDNTFANYFEFAHILWQFDGSVELTVKSNLTKTEVFEIIKHDWSEVPN